MAKSNKIAAVILGAAAGVALVKFLSMPREQRNEFYDFLKNKSRQLLDNAEDTVEKVEQYMDEFKEKGDDEWIDKIYILKKMFKSLYGSERNYLL
ncbi:MAG TPA: YtxH domain-containing protein [Hanamia sp.]